jgi:hypothetical protein
MEDTKNTKLVLVERKTTVFVIGIFDRINNKLLPERKVDS